MRLNRYYSKKLGWGQKRKEIEQRLIKALNWPAIIGENGWAMAVANWQMRQMGLSVDGVIGPNTWRRLQVLACQDYESGEAAKSQTQSGHLIQDVMMFRGSLLIADFGVNQSTVKSSTQREKLLQEWLKRFETADPPYDLIILGFSDCVGAEKDNEALRKARAAAVLKLLGPRARSRVVFVGSARKDAYITDDNRNVSVRERAMNRSVFIQFKRKFDYEAETITVKPPSLKDIIDNCNRLLDKQKELGFNFSAEQIKRWKCMLNMLAYPEVDDRYIGEAKWMNGSMYLLKKVSPEFLERQFITPMRDNLRRLHPSRPEKEILQNIEIWDSDIFYGIMRKAKGLEKPAGGGPSASPGDQQIYEWISARQREPKSIYSGFTHGCEILTVPNVPLYPWEKRRIP
jgi:outer membrane protein OmpA-like peptidoglycan-associated protein